ncbi:MAG: S8 family peptidase, partial [Pseudomonadota bacterium]
PEFAGRIHPASTNTAGTASDFQDIDGHGTFVASVAAGAKNDGGTHGVAFDAQILALRSDSGQSCLSADGCSHFDSDIAEALDVARVEGAKVVNMSLGGGGANFQLRQAIERATDAGVIVVISGGNDFLDQPDSFALVALDQRSNGRVLIAGYTDENNERAFGVDAQGNEFGSNAAGSAGDVFVVAPGVDIRASGLDNDEFLVSGSSFSAPHVSGAIAVLYDLFPELTADEMIELITSTATDLGAPGIDTIYGHGLINLEAALQPQGQMQTSVTAAGQSTAALVSGPAAPSAFGNSLSLGLAGTSALSFDRFNRAYTVPLSQFAQAAAPTLAVSALFDTRQRFAHSALQDGTGMMRARFAVQQQTPLSPELLDQFGGAFADRADQQQVSAQMQMDLGRARFATYVNQRPQTGLADLNDNGLLSLMDTDAAQYGLGSAPAALRVMSDYKLSGGWSIGMAAARRDTLFERTALSDQTDASLTQSAVSVQWDRDSVAIRTMIGIIRERGQVLGAQASRGALSLGDGARTRFAQLALSAKLGGRWHFDADAAYGRATLDDAGVQSLFAATGDLSLTSWSAQLRTNALVSTQDAFALTLRQPQRVEAGSAAFAALPTVTTQNAQFSLAPDGRQIDVEAAYGVTLPGLATLSANVLMRRDAGHVAGQHDMAGLVRFTSRF